jgi:hypothetical protein
MANLLAQLPQRGLPMRIAQSKASARRDPDGSADLSPLNLLQQHSAEGIEQHDARGGSLDCSTLHGLL